jgi:hypothetical protein
LLIVLVVVVVVVLGQGTNASKGVSAGRREVNGGASGAVLVPVKSRTKDDHEDDYDFGEGRMSKGENIIMLSC